MVEAESRAEPEEAEGDVVYRVENLVKMFPVKAGFMGSLFGREQFVQNRPRRPGGHSEVAAQHGPEPTEILDRQRPVEAICPLDLRDELRRGEIGHHGGHWIAGRQMHEGKADYRYANQDRQNIGNAPQSVPEHRLRFRRNPHSIRIRVRS